MLGRVDSGRAWLVLMGLDVIDRRGGAGDLPASLAACLSDWLSKQRKAEDTPGRCRLVLLPGTPAKQVLVSVAQDREGSA